jgi:uncharacterized protein
MRINGDAEIQPLDRHEIHALLARNTVGRIAYARGNQVDIEPIHYIYHDGWLYGRTSRGAKLEVTGDTWWPVAFEVDEYESPEQWCSAVVHGGFYTLNPERSGWEREEWNRAVEIIRTVFPRAFTPDDPTPARTVVFRIAVQEVSGRRAIEAPPRGTPELATTGHA